MSGPDLIAAHRRSIRHRAELEASLLCGRFYCLSTFPPSGIVKWIDDGQTALCLNCQIDAAIGSASGYEISPEWTRDKRLLQAAESLSLPIQPDAS